MTDRNAPRVMLLVPQFWISGTVTLAREMQFGWPSEWPRPCIMCPTKSGRRSSMWGRDVSDIKRATSTPWEPDATGSVKDVIRMASESFDLIHVTEPDIPNAYREWWHQLLEQLPIPWTLTLNGNAYKDVHWDRILAAKNFTGVVWQTPGNVSIELCDNNMTLVPLPRPYTVKYAIDANLPRTPHAVFDDNDIVIGTHCRIAPDKGIAVLMALSKHIGANVCLDGAVQGGCVPYTVAIQQHYLDEANMVPPEIPWVSSASKITPGHFCYNGAFVYGINVARHHDVHISSTRRGFSAGHEYALLEAIDAGCVIVQPKHMTEPDCELVQYTYDWKSQGIVGALTRANAELSMMVMSAIAHVKRGYDQTVNRRAIAQYHNPNKLIRTFMSEVFNRLG